MCGIAAIISTNQNLQNDIQKMIDIIHYRGPDDEGQVLLNFKNAMTVALGHRRLSILDLNPTGHQPFSNSTKTLWMTYNGEVYNYIEIREELKSLGYTFTSQTDTEVILKAYEEWGTEALHKFNGMFAFVIADLKKNLIFAARDRFGVKPLYYWISPDGSIAFASEIKQFSVLPHWQAKLHHQMAYDFLNWGHIDHTRETLFKDVLQVQGGEFLLFSPDNPVLTPQRWYNPTIVPFTGNFVQACDRFKEILSDSIRLRMRADVEVGSCLSGGMDSSSIVSLSSKLLPAGVQKKTFTACSAWKKYDERSYVEAIIDKSGARAHYIYPSMEDLRNHAKKIIWHQESPYSSTSIFAQWMVFQKAGEHKMKVMLDGQGADESLGGYSNFFSCRFQELFRSGQWLKLYNEIKISRKALNTHPVKFLLHPLVPSFIRQSLRRKLSMPSTEPSWINFNVLQANDIPPFESQEYSFLSQSQLLLTQSSLPMLLHWEDRNSMAHSIESRTPFLDYRLVEFNLGLPAEYKLSDGWTKKVLRESMRGVLPECVRTRRDKMAFVTPEELWMKNSPDFFRGELRRAIEVSQGIINPSALEMFDEMVKGKRPFSFLLWRMISFGQWMEIFTIRT